MRRSDGHGGVAPGEGLLGRRQGGLVTGEKEHGDLSRSVARRYEVVHDIDHSTTRF
jgi:hypothetical protein